jgi:hypothetical protein
MAGLLHIRLAVQGGRRQRAGIRGRAALSGPDSEQPRRLGASLVGAVNAAHACSLSPGAGTVASLIRALGADTAARAIKIIGFLKIASTDLSISRSQGRGWWAAIRRL